MEPRRSESFQRPDKTFGVSKRSTTLVVVALVVDNLKTPNVLSGLVEKTHYVEVPLYVVL